MAVFIDAQLSATTSGSQSSRLKRSPSIRAASADVSLHRLGGRLPPVGYEVSSLSFRHSMLFFFDLRFRISISTSVLFLYN